MCIRAYSRSGVSLRLPQSLGILHDGHDKLDMKLWRFSTLRLVRAGDQCDCNAIITVGIRGINVHISPRSWWIGIQLGAADKMIKNSTQCQKIRSDFQHQHPSKESSRTYTLASLTQIVSSANFASLMTPFHSRKVFCLEVPKGDTRSRRHASPVHPALL